MEGDADTVRELMTDDVDFLTLVRPPFGRDEFLESFAAMKDQVTMECAGEYEEIVVASDIVYARAKLNITVTPKTTNVTKRLSGNTLSIFSRCGDGKWRLCRDANLVTLISDRFSSQFSQSL